MSRTAVSLPLCWWLLLAILSPNLFSGIVEGVELTFELPDNAKECFHEIIEKDTESTLEFQVVTGGHYDVDVILTDPTRNQLYKQIKKQYDSFTWTAEKTGDEDPLPGLEAAQEPLTQMETSAREIHENMNAVIDYQTHHRLRETQGRHRAEDLNERIMIWSVFVTVAIFLVGFGQVFVLKSFFSEKRPSQMYGRH